MAKKLSVDIVDTRSGNAVSPKEVYDLLMAAQSGSCAICNKTPEPGKRLVLEHEHTTGQIRGLLCRPCSQGLNLFREDTDAMKRAVTYMKKVRKPKFKVTVGGE